jgi:hypothetical protein
VGQKSQRQKERYTKKRAENRKKQKQAQSRQQALLNRSDIPLGSNARHRQRLAQQIPQAFPNETPVDVAIFDDAVLSTLPPELAAQVSDVRAALQDATESRGDEALKRTSTIARNSPLSDWRLFIRGLVSWLAEETAEAGEVWKRLDPERRPGRIATVLMIALHTDLDQRSPRPQSGEPVGASQDCPWDHWDDQLLYSARLVRRVRFDRTALQIAESGLKSPEEVKELQLGPRKIRWLKEFVKEYGETEPELTVALAQGALHRVSVQNYSDLFDEVTRAFRGPRHDPSNLLLIFFYYGQFQNNERAEIRSEKALEQYLEGLPKNAALPAALRGAIVGLIHYNEAMSLLRPSGKEGGMAGMMAMMANIFDPPEDARSIRKHFRAAVRAYPQNLPAHKAYAAWLEDKLDDDRSTQAQRKTHEAELAEVMREWSQDMPQETEPRLWLVDYLLENEKMEEAKPHVEFLAAARQEDPRVRATPWKWQILEAMRLCRRKAWLSQVPAHLDEAERLWPTWLSKDWLPYLRAAATLRGGLNLAFKAEHEQICQASGRALDSLTDACMMLGAAQQMRVPAADLKPLRAALDRALRNLDAVPLEDLVAVGAFFWDLQRARLVYPAYRMHAKDIGLTLLITWQEEVGEFKKQMDDEQTQKAVLWCSEHRFWEQNRYSDIVPAYFPHTSAKQPLLFAAAELNSFLKGHTTWKTKGHLKQGKLLREAAPAQRDAYYRYWFVALADKLDSEHAKNLAPSFASPFGNIFGGNDDYEDEFEYEEEEDLGFDPDCDCADCQAGRKAYEKAQTRNRI